MPTYKVLGQSAPSATTLTTLYTATSQAVVSTVNAANFGGTQDTIRIAVRPAGASIANQHYVAYGVPLAAGAVFSMQAGITLADTDVISVYSTTGNTAFHAYGSEGI